MPDQPVVRGADQPGPSAPVLNAPPRDYPRVLVEAVHPELDAGRFAVKREQGAVFEVWADIVMDGHDLARAVLRYIPPGAEAREVPMVLVDNDRWRGRFRLDHLGRTRYQVEAWPDRFGTWVRDTGRKQADGQDIRLDLQEGRALVADAVAGAERAVRAALERLLDSLGEDPLTWAAALTAPETRALMAKADDRRHAGRSRLLEVAVDRVEARCAAWYEIMPRSQSPDPGRTGTLADCIDRLPAVRDMGFDVLYLLPIHPIGRVNRKGRNNSLTAEPGDPGSPYAIGSPDGGHDAVEPALGSLDDFRRLVAAARSHGLEIALDFAIQCAPDHPWVAAHPEWIRFRPDGSIKYAENPPKKYQDIVNVDFEGAGPDGLWQALRDAVLFWVAEGVEIFRVDNPHTKPFLFWEWLIREVHARNPRVIFLAEAFTRPKLMKALAKLGFTQSYTYFTWRNTKAELTEYLTELTRSGMQEYYRPNFFPVTPDILPHYLQTSGRPGFMVRLVLAATLASVYGVYSGFELCEAAALPGREEYANSEKYEIKHWDWDRPGHIKDLIQAVNRIRRDNPALQYLTTLEFCNADNPAVIFYAKIMPDRSNAVFVAVNLDPHQAQETMIDLPLGRLGLAPDRPYLLDDLLLGHSWWWTGGRQHLRLEPGRNPAAIFRINPQFLTPEIPVGEPSDEP